MLCNYFGINILDSALAGISKLILLHNTHVVASSFCTLALEFPVA